MNPTAEKKSMVSPYFPRASGDEPSRHHVAGNDLAIFPARVGMNRDRQRHPRELDHFPRASGDEPPAQGAAADDEEFSPREWG